MQGEINIDDLLPGYPCEADSLVRKSNDNISRLIEIWLNERHSPELLEYESKLVSTLMKALDKQVEYVATLRCNALKDQTSIVLREQEIERIKFILRSYLRTRLSKIQKYTHYYLKNETYRKRMSDPELKFATSFDSLLETTYMEVILKKFPLYFQNLGSADDLDIIRKPDLEQAVICRAKKEIGEVYINEEESIIMTQGSIYILRYTTIINMLKEGLVELI